MIPLDCPQCGHRFWVLVIESRGWCRCGMDYELSAAGDVTWTEDPAYPWPAETS